MKAHKFVTIDNGQVDAIIDYDYYKEHGLVNITINSVKTGGIEIVDLISVTETERLMEILESDYELSNFKYWQD